MQKSFGKADLIACVFVIFSALAFYGYSFLGNTDENLKLVVVLEGEVIEEIPLSSVKEKEVFFTTAEYENEFTIDNGAVKMTSASCPGQDCLHTHEISRAGSVIICLPSQLELRLVSDKSDIDGVTG